MDFLVFNAKFLFQDFTKNSLYCAISTRDYEELTIWEIILAFASFEFTTDFQNFNIQSYQIKQKKCGVLYIVDRKGTHYFHKPYAEINAKLLIKYGFIDSPESLPENIDMEIYRSLLMGYTNLSIILYRLVNEYDQKLILYEDDEGEMIEDDNDQKLFLNDNNYMDKVGEYIKYYEPIVEETRDFIKSQGGILFKD